MTEIKDRGGGIRDPMGGDEFYDLTYNPGDDEEDEVIGWECLSCGHVQGGHLGLQCDRCCGPLAEMFF